MDNLRFILRAASRILFNVVSIPLGLLGAPIVCLFARWDRVPTPARWQPEPIIRGDLPRWARWWETPDERLPGGMYEPTVESIYKRFGRYWCSVYWLGIRNRMYGLSFALFGEPAESITPSRTQKFLGPLHFDWGYFVYFATPDFTVERCSFIKIWDFKIKSNRGWWKKVLGR